MKDNQCRLLLCFCPLMFKQVLWELLTKEVPFNGIEGFQVAWLVVEKGEVICTQICLLISHFLLPALI